MAYEHKTSKGSWILHSTGENGGTVALKIRDRRAISLQRSELLKSMVRTVLIIVVVECFGPCFPSSWFEVFGKDRFSLSQLVPIIKFSIFRFKKRKKQLGKLEKRSIVRENFSD